MFHVEQFVLKGVINPLSFVVKGVYYSPHALTSRFRHSFFDYSKRCSAFVFSVAFKLFSCLFACFLGGHTFPAVGVQPLDLVFIYCFALVCHNFEFKKCVV